MICKYTLIKRYLTSWLCSLRKWIGSHVCHTPLARKFSSRNSLQWPIYIINQVDKTKLSDKICNRNKFYANYQKATNFRKRKNIYWFDDPLQLVVKSSPSNFYKRNLFSRYKYKASLTAQEKKTLIFLTSKKSSNQQWKIPGTEKTNKQKRL